MYTDKKNILQLVALLEAHGITKGCVVSRVVVIRPSYILCLIIRTSPVMQ